MLALTLAYNPWDLNPLNLLCSRAFSSLARAAPNGQGTRPSQGTCSTSSWAERGTFQKPAHLGSGGVDVEGGVGKPRVCSQDVRLLGGHRQDGLPTAWLRPARGFWDHWVWGRKSLASSSKVVPVASMGPSACQTVSIKACFGWCSVLFCFWFGFDCKKKLKTHLC